MTARRHLLRVAGASLVALALQACSPGPFASVVKTGVRQAEASGRSSTKIRVKDPDTGQSKVLTYVKDGADWVLKGCEILDQAGQPCTEPEAPYQVTP